MRLKILDVDYHRNGISGEGFSVVRFRHDGAVMVGVVFKGKGRVAVLDVAKLAAGDVAFGSNSWRGDDFEPELRAAVAKADRCRHPNRNLVSTAGNGAKYCKCLDCHTKFWSAETTAITEE